MDNKSVEKSLISVTAPGDVFGTITAIANTITSLSDTIRAIAQDQSPEGRATARTLLELIAGPAVLLQKLNQRLGIDPLQPHQHVEHSEISQAKIEPTIQFPSYPGTT